MPCLLTAFYATAAVTLIDWLSQSHYSFLSMRCSMNANSGYSESLALVSPPAYGCTMKYFTLEIFKNFVEILKYFKTPSLKYFMKFLIFITK